MINSVRQQLGLSQLIVSQGSQDFARYLTTSYKATHGNTRPFFNYGQAGVAGHRGITHTIRPLFKHQPKKLV
ncbi:hypothetical protein ABG808_04695 [Streptococcus iniae]